MKLKHRLTAWLDRIPAVAQGRGAGWWLRLHAWLMRRSWNRLHDGWGLGAISFLQSADGKWNEQEFRLVGERFVARMLERFRSYGDSRLADAGVLEIGCGTGRFLGPLSVHFHTVTGVDVSEAMLATARRRLAGVDNIRYLQNNGQDLSAIADASLDYVICAGVLQHITVRAVIIGYLREGLRVLRPGGLFLFQFMGNRARATTTNVLVGAQIRARDLDAGLAGLPYRIRELSRDPVDRNATFVVVLEKLAPGSATPPAEYSFLAQEVRWLPWLDGVYDGLGTQTLNQKRAPDEPLADTTFFD